MLALIFRANAIESWHKYMYPRGKLMLHRGSAPLSPLTLYPPTQQSALSAQPSTTTIYNPPRLLIADRSLRLAILLPFSI